MTGSHVGWGAGVHTLSLVGLPDLGVAVYNQSTQLPSLPLPLQAKQGA